MGAREDDLEDWKRSSRLEFLALFKKHEKQAREQVAALIPIMFMGTISSM